MPINMNDDGLQLINIKWLAQLMTIESEMMDEAIKEAMAMGFKLDERLLETHTPDFTPTDDKLYDTWSRGSKRVLVARLPDGDEMELFESCTTITYGVDPAAELIAKDAEQEGRWNVAIEIRQDNMIRPATVVGRWIHNKRKARR